MGGDNGAPGGGDDGDAKAGDNLAADYDDDDLPPIHPTLTPHNLELRSSTCY